jgi:hypothetical protein
MNDLVPRSTGTLEMRIRLAVERILPTHWPSYETKRREHCSAPAIDRSRVLVSARPPMIGVSLNREGLPADYIPTLDADYALTGPWNM